MSKKKKTKKDDYNLVKLALLTAIISLIEKILDVIIKIIEIMGT